MALTHHLKSSRSPVRQFLYEVAPHFRLAGSPGHLGKDIAREFGFNKLMSKELLLPIPASVKDKRGYAAPVGVAFDYRVRMMLGGFTVDDSAAATGLQQFGRRAKDVRRGSHMARVLSDALEIAQERAAGGTDADWDRLAVVLAWCESFYRAGIHIVIDGSLGKELRRAKTGEVLLQSMDSLILEDLAALRSGAAEQVAAWNERLAEGDRFESNPDFSGSSLVGGADADWSIGDTLIDCKTTERLTNPWIREALFQLLGYTLLDLDDSLRIRQLAIWLPRRRALQTWSIDQILERPAEEALPDLRAQFERTLGAWRAQALEEARARREAAARRRGEMED